MLNKGGIVHRLESIVTLIGRRRAIQSQIDALAKQQGEIDDNIRSIESEVAEEMKARRVQKVSFKGVLYRIQPSELTGHPDRIWGEPCLTLSEADAGSFQ